MKNSLHTEKRNLPETEEVNTAKGLTNQNNLLNVGHVKQSISVQISIAAFLLVLTVTSLVSFFFYGETERILTKQITSEVVIESNLVEPMIERLYSEAYSDILFLSRIPSIQEMIISSTNDDTKNYQLAKKKIEQTFTEFLSHKDFYYQIRYIGVANNGQELVNVRDDNLKLVMPNSRLQEKSQRPYFSATIQKDPGHVYFSKIELAKNYGKVELPHKPVLRASTPIYDAATGKVFGLVIINLNFGKYIEQLKTKELRAHSLYLTNDEGDYVTHPDNSKTFGFDLEKRYLIQDEFTILAPIIQGNVPSYDLGTVTVNDKNYLAHFKTINLSLFDSAHQLNLLILKDRTEMESTLSAYRFRSILVGGALALLALIIAIIASRKVATPLKNITNSMKNYEHSNRLSKLPIDNNTEIGVLARSFNNLFTKMQLALQEQENSALLAKQSADQISAIFSSAAEGFITIDEKGVILAFNQAAQKMFGYRESEILGHNIKILMPESESIKHDVYLQNYQDTGIANIIGKGRKLHGLKKSGETFPIHLSISTVSRSEKTVFTGIIRDISKEVLLELEQERNQQALLEVNERISLATDAASLGIWQYEIATNKLTWDKWMHLIYELPQTEFKGELEDWQNLVHPDDLDKVTKAMALSIQNKTNLNYEFRVITPSGAIKYIKAMALIKTDNHGHPVHFIGVNSDITELKAVEKEHIDAKELAEDAARHKTEFLASMSHEIRTPMNGILGMLGLLLRNELSEDQRHRVKLANSSAEALLSVINDILDFSKVEAGKIELEVLDFDLRKLLGELTESLAIRAQEKNIEIILDVQGIEISHVKGDPGRLRQILNNLMGNAIKFTDDGEIVIKASIKEEAQALTLYCEISDSGIGIPKDKIANLFNSFTQVDASTTRKYGGTGLGLAISKQLCQLLQGEINVSSEVGKGTTFSFNLKLSPSKLATKITPRIDISHTKILIVDDNRTNRTTLANQLSHWGAVVYQADSGISALALLNQYNQAKLTDKITIAYIDMDMPNMDGAELAREIQQNKILTDIKLVMMTSMESIATSSDANYFKKLGFTTYFPKPAITRDLLKSLNSCLTNNSQSKTQKKVPSTSGSSTEKKSTIQENTLYDFSNYKALLVEDNRINQEVARHILLEFGINPAIANNGYEAIAQLQKNKFDVVFMDCQMPEMDGYQATAAIRNSEAGKDNTDVLIIAMTANAMKGDKEKCLDAGMTDYLSKPIEPEQIGAKLCEYLEPSSVKVIPHKKKTKTIESEAKSTELSPTIVNKENNVDNDAKVNNTKDNDNLAVWHQEAFAKRLHGNTDIQKKLITLFLETVPELLTELSTSINLKDTEQQRAISHKLQGMSANLSALELLKNTKDFNEYIKIASPENTEVSRLFNAIKLSFDSLAEQLRQAISH